MKQELKLGFIGAGVVGTALAHLLFSKGWNVNSVYSRTSSSAGRLADLVQEVKICTVAGEVVQRSDVVFISTSDGAIAEVAADIARQQVVSSRHTFIHLSGALTTDVLEAVRRQGATVFSMHPLQSFASVEQAVENLPGSIFSVEGDEDGYCLAENLVEDLGGEFFLIKKDAKALYHAAACVASNYLVTLLDVSTGMLEVAGIPRKFALRAVLPLVEGTVNNLRQLGIPDALTGPIARGDSETLKDHLEVISEKVPELESIYRQLAVLTTEVAERKKTIDAAKGEELRKLLEI